MITIDTSAIVTLFNRRDSMHHAVTTALYADAGPYIVPAFIMAEIAYVLDARLGSESVEQFLQNITTARLFMDCGEGDIDRIQNLVTRYADMPLGFADAAVVACAERYGGTVLTLDHRHFGVVARDADITIVP